jgi:hypothetical protein
MVLTAVATPLLIIRQTLLWIDCDEDLRCMPKPHPGRDHLLCSSQQGRQTGVRWTGARWSYGAATGLVGDKQVNGHESRNWPETTTTD